ncbi:class I SAM-dependent methyltransferase [Anaerocolumna chitinilytica]|uniref:Methyltransferase type 11 n=1 Tax=Anaerocolumna chitinilytica TaxID=1727145 RepID=A0A7M3S9P3_9FIRM|nr:class I SAM-dependent methyltransferase [Anaerocolumna chitinilytica]BCK01311.1 methyltransferase type 11 [Anaerocolumna chitinilytica]
MKAKGSDWYKSIWTLEAKNQSWVEETENQVEFIIKTLNLTGKEHILDLACGFGRHSLAFARRGFSVVGVDITKEFINDAIKSSEEESLQVQFIHSDIRDIRFNNEFDVVLNLADGAIGYLESDEENLKIFDVISTALKSGGKHFMDVCNAEHAEYYFPKHAWEIGASALSLSLFEWDRKNRRMLYGGCDIPYGEPAKRPEIPYGDPIRLYTLEELQSIFYKRNMKIVSAFSNYNGKEASYKELQLMVYSLKL